MKFYAFHLMPYADLDPQYTEKYDSAWVTLPNTYFDRERGHALYNRYLDELELADAAGFDGVCVNEHHQNAYGLMPIPGIIAGALSRRVKGKLLVLGRALPLLNNPLTVAEEYAMLDQITGGRLIAGFVRGIGAEYHSWGVNPTESHDRFHEAHDLIIQAWTKAGPFHFEGKYYDFEYVNTWPRVFQ
ncbi:MAG TPA: LLM class flavin-dependent oxidoreductase, partial [Candidatus Limnocylindria bacterium]|nr:LLM class flavin-dependent oxidoreductase [Candidatus Limnocylindria bacterium]